jgi:hypothetical protein
VAGIEPFVHDENVMLRKVGIEDGGALGMTRSRLRLTRRPGGAENCPFVIS